MDIDVYLGGAPLLEARLGEGLLAFGEQHPGWRFAMRGHDFRYSARVLREVRPDGVLVLIDSKPVATSLNQAGIPWVHLLPGRTTTAHSVRVDDLEIGRQGAFHFLEKGFLRCAFCGVGTPWSNERYLGFSETLKNEQRNPQFIDVPFSGESHWSLSVDTVPRLRTWLTTLKPGTAIMAAHDTLANRIVTICREEGIRVPHDLAVMGVGNHDLLCKLSPVPITSVDARVPTVAYRGAELLRSLIEGAPCDIETVITPKGVEERGSTEIIAYGNDIVARVIEVIRAEAVMGITVEDILNRFPVSRRTLTRRFAKYVGHSPAAEIRKARLHEAEKLLQDPSRTLTDIAAACGYSDLSHMNRAFQQVHAIAPSELRQKHGVSKELSKTRSS